MKRVLFILILQFVAILTIAQDGSKGFSIVEQPEDKEVKIYYNGNLLTAYCYYDSIKKSFLFPVRTLDGITVTRGYPLKPTPGERTDHPHHTGVWMNYESVNGFDFWNNSTSIPFEKRNGYGTIRHNKILDKQASKDKATLVVTADWYRPDGQILIKEKTIYEFIVKDNIFFIDRVSELTATEEQVVFKDIKDGFFAIRVARELEMPSTQTDIFLDAYGNKTAVPKMDNEGVTGMYYSSEGIKGDSVWSSKARWVMLQGQKQGKEIIIGIFDHPSNIGYPAYWHARGYGLFAVNPLGRKIFSNGKEELNFSLKPNSSATFRYRMMIASGSKFSDKEMNKLAEQFAKSK